MPTASFRYLPLLLALCAPTASQAGRPLVTEDAGVLEPGSCELETYARRITERAAPSSNGFSLQYGCGVGLRTQVAMATTMDRADGATVRGLVFGGKTSISDGGEADPSWTLAWGLAAEKLPGASLSHESTWLNGVLSMPLGKDLKLHANLGWTRAQSTHQSTTGWAVALERSTTSGVDVMGEAFASDRDRAPWLQVGLRWAAVPEKVFIDGSWGFQTVSSRPRMLTVGLKAAF